MALCGVCISALFGVGLGSESAAGGFVVFVYRHCVCVLCVGQFGVGLGE